MSLDEINRQKARAYDLYMTADGGMNLEPVNSRITTENAVLYLAIFYALLRRARKIDFEDKDHAAMAVRNVQLARGLYAKYAGNTTRVNSHDNYVGLCSLEPILGLPIATDICSYGDHSGYCFNNLRPGIFSLSGLRQLGEIALYKFCARIKPNLVEILWLCVGLIISAFTTRGITHHLTWLRVEALKITFQSLISDKEWVPFISPVIFCYAIFDLSMKLRFGNTLYPVWHYYTDQSHPNRIMALELGGMRG